MLDPELRNEILSDVKLAGIVPVPVAAITAGSACWRSHSMVSPSDLWPSSRVSWKTLAAQSAGMRMRRPRPSTLVCRSFVDVRFGGGFFDGSAEAAAAEAAALGFAPLVSTEEEIARDGYGTMAVVVVVVAEEDELLEHASSSFFSSNWNGKVGRRLWWWWW